MKLFSQNLELLAISSITQPDVGISEGKLHTSSASKISSIIMSGVNDLHFHYEPCKAAYKRIVSIAKRKARILSYNDLIEDPALEEEYRDILAENYKKPVRTTERAFLLLEYLDKYRKVRSLYFLSRSVVDALKEPKVDVEELLDMVTTDVTKIRAQLTTDPIHTIGYNSNAFDLIDEALSVEDENLYKTGFKEFDTRSGGLPSEGVMILAATTSGGKSALRMNLLKNMYFLNKISVATVSLEMNEKKEVRRLLSSLTGVEYWKFVRKTLSREEREHAKKEWKIMHNFGKKHRCTYSLFCPTRSININQLLTLMKPYGFHVLAIDYISLLEGVSTKDQWRILGDVARECKVYSAETKSLVVLLAQLDQNDDHIRYSGALAENADNVWAWNYSKREQRDLKILPIRQMKARDQDLFDFDLREEFEIMSVSDPTESSTAQSSRESNLDIDPLADPNVSVE